MTGQSGSGSKRVPSVNFTEVIRQIAVLEHGVSPSTYC